MSKIDVRCLRVSQGARSGSGGGGGGGGKGAPLRLSPLQKKRLAAFLVRADAVCDERALFSANLKRYWARRANESAATHAERLARAAAPRLLAVLRKALRSERQQLQQRGDARALPRTAAVASALPPQRLLRSHSFSAQ